MKDFALEVLNSGSSDNVSLLSDEAMSEALGGKISCKKGFDLEDNGAITCACGYSNNTPIIITQPGPKPILPPGTIITE